MKRLFVMVGNIGTGKSTFVRKFLELQTEKTVCVCRDSLRYMIGGGTYVFDPLLEPTILFVAEEMVKGFMGTSVSIILDETNIKAEYRSPHLHCADAFGYRKIALVMPYLDKKTCVDRRMQNPHDTDRQIWEGVWDKFDSQYEEPTTREGFDGVIKITEEFLQNLSRVSPTFGIF